MPSLIRRRQSATVFAGLLVGGLCFSTGSYSQTPFPAVYSVSAFVEGSNPNLSSNLAVPGSVSVGPGCIYGVSCGSASASLSGALDLSISGSTNGGYELPEAIASATATVYYYVIGPPGSADTAVPMIFSGNFSGSASGVQASDFAGVQLSSTSGTIGGSGCATSYSSTTCGSSFSAPFLFNSANGFYVNSSSAYTNVVGVSLNGSAYAAGQFSAQLDPTLEIDPTWLTEHPGYSLVFSSNYAPVPLPAAAWLLLSGLGGLGLLGTRKRQELAV